MWRFVPVIAFHSEAAGQWCGRNCVASAEHVVGRLAVMNGSVPVVIGNESSTLKCQLEQRPVFQPEALVIKTCELYFVYELYISFPLCDLRGGAPRHLWNRWPVRFQPLSVLCSIFCFLDLKPSRF